MSQLQLSACWSKLAARTANQATAKKYVDYAIAGREGQPVPACDAGPVPAVPMPQGVTLVDDDPARRFTEEKLRLDNRIAALHGKQEETRATVEKKRAAVETLEKISQSATDPKAKHDTDTLLAEAKNTLAEALEEDRRATEEIGRAESELKALNERGPAPRPGATATR